MLFTDAGKNGKSYHAHRTKLTTMTSRLSVIEIYHVAEGKNFYLAPHVELENAFRHRAPLERLVGSILLGQLAGCRHRREVHRLKDISIQSFCLLALERHAHLPCRIDWNHG